MNGSSRRPPPGRRPDADWCRSAASAQPHAPPPLPLPHPAWATRRAGYAFVSGPHSGASRSWRAKRPGCADATRGGAPWCGSNNGGSAQPSASPAGVAVAARVAGPVNREPRPASSPCLWHRFRAGDRNGAPVRRRGAPQLGDLVAEGGRLHHRHLRNAATVGAPHNVMATRSS